jgi:tRNA(fMet)-specific endonuclease VapC
MKYLLDTDAFSDIVRGNINVESRFSRTPLPLIGISSVTVKEIEYGRSLCPERVIRRGALINSILQKIDAVPFDSETAYVTGRLRASLTRVGTPIGPYDVMIAGTALVHGLILVTANTREFSRVSGLQLENWRLSQSEVRDSAGEYQVKGESLRRMFEAA